MLHGNVFQAACKRRYSVATYGIKPFDVVWEPSVDVGRVQIGDAVGGCRRGGSSMIRRVFKCLEWLECLDWHRLMLITWSGWCGGLLLLGEAHAPCRVGVGEKAVTTGGLWEVWGRKHARLHKGHSRSSNVLAFSCRACRLLDRKRLGGRPTRSPCTRTRGRARQARQTEDGACRTETKRLPLSCNSSGRMTR